MVLETRARGEIPAGNVARTCAQTAISVMRQSVNQAAASPAMVPGERRSRPECAGRPEGRHVASHKPLQGIFIMPGVRPLPVVDAPIRIRVVIAVCHVALRAAVTDRRRGRGRNAGVLQVAIRRCDQRSGPAVKRFLCRRDCRSQPAHASWSGRPGSDNAHVCVGRDGIPSYK